MKKIIFIVILFLSACLVLLPSHALASTYIEGDLDHNNKVDIYDYNLLVQNFGNTTCGNVADIDGNCKVDIFDYNILVGNFGKTINAAISPVFGVQAFHKNQTVDKSIIAQLSVEVTTHWLYYPTAGGSRQWVADQKNNQIDPLKSASGLEIPYVHIMPSDRKEKFDMPSDMDEYEAIIEALAGTLKKSGVRYYSIGNEFSKAKFTGTPHDYNVLLERSRRGILKGDPSAVILDSGMAGQTYVFPIAKSMVDRGDAAGALAFTQLFLKRFSNYDVPQSTVELIEDLEEPLAADAISWHNANFTEFCKFYDVFQLHDYQGWETMDTVYTWIKDQMKENKCIKPIQIWELGYGQNRGKFDETDHAQSVVKMVTISAAQGAQLINYYPLYDAGDMFKGLVDEDKKERRAYDAYLDTIGKLTGATQVQSLNLGNNVTAYKFTRQGKDVYVVWSTTNTTVNLPFTGPAKVTDILGNPPTTTNSNSIAVSVSPVFVEPE